MYHKLKTLTSLSFGAVNMRYQMADKFEPRKKYFNNNVIPK